MSPVNPNKKREVFALGSASLFCFLLALIVTWCALTGCGRFIYPYPPPTVTPTNAPATHIPTLTLTPFPSTATWTPTLSPTSFLTFTPTLTETSSPTATVKPLPSFTPTAAVTPTPTLPLLPHTGASAQDIGAMTKTPAITITTTPLPTITPPPPPPTATLESTPTLEPMQFKNCVQYSFKYTRGLGWEVSYLCEGFTGDLQSLAKSD